MPTKAGTITLARHGAPAIDRSVTLNAPQYGEFWATYETVGIRAEVAPPEHLLVAAREAQVVMCSTRPRAIASCQVLVGETPFTQDVRLIEAPLPHPPFPAFIRMKPKLWGFFSRWWWWWFNHHRGQETRAEASVRARGVAAEISASADKGQNVLVVAHGFFNAMLGVELRRLGWKKTLGRGWKYWSTRRYERR